MMRLGRRTSLLAFSLLAGCALTLSELRQAPPQRTATTVAERAPLASCILSGLRAADPGTFVPRAGSLIYQTEESATRTEIAGYGQGAGPGFVPFYILTLTTAGPRVAIESRWNWVPQIAQEIDGQAWPIIERCAGSKIDVTPSLD